MSVQKTINSPFNFRTNFVLSADFDKQRPRDEINKLLLWTLLAALILSGIRQILRLRLMDGNPSEHPFSDIDGVNVIFTMILTVTFYPMLYKSYSFVYKGTEEKGTDHILYRVALLSQLAVLRDLLYIIHVFIDYGRNLFDGRDLMYNDFIFTTLDSLVWFLTIVMFVPVVIPRLNKPKSQDDTLIQAFILSFITFWLTWIFNYVILRVFVELPFGGRLFT